MNSILKGIAASLIVATMVSGIGISYKVVANTSYIVGAKKEQVANSLMLNKINEAIVRIEANQGWIRKNQEHLLNEIDELKDQ